MNTQCQLVLEHLSKGLKLTSMDAFTKYKITRLSGRIFDLRKQGYDISTMIVTKGRSSYAEYSLNRKEQKHEKENN